MNTSMHNLTGSWQGIFNFPRLYEPVSFSALLQQDGEWLTGSTEELAVRSVMAGATLTATLMGKVTGRELTFMKTYDQEVRSYDAVQYAGVLDVEGVEIEGTWTIPGNWSGTFLMIRASEPNAVLSKSRTEKV